MPSSEPSTERMAKCRDAWKLHHEQGMSFADIAYGWELVFENGQPRRGMIQRMVDTYDHWRVVSELRQQNALLQTRVIELEAAIESDYEPSARDWNDFDQWQGYLKTAQSLPRMLKVMFYSDLHLPDTNWQAVDLALQIAESFQPDVNVFLGDEYDFQALSTKFPRASNRKNRDAFKEVAAYWHRTVDRVQTAAPGSISVMIGGNHTKGRVEAYINQNAGALDETILEAFISMVRSENRVWWLGWTDEMWIGNLHVEHGTRTGENASKNSLKDVGWANPRVGGHVHMPSSYLNFNYVKTDNLARPRRVWIQSITTPALCNIVPDYNPGMSKKEREKQQQKTRWANGCAVGYVNLAGDDVHLQNILFHERSDGSLVAVFGSGELIQPAIEQKAKVAA